MRTFLVQMLRGAKDKHGFVDPTNYLRKVMRESFSFDLAIARL